MLHTKCPFQARFKALVSLKYLCEFFSNLLPLNIRFYYYELQCKSYMSNSDITNKTYNQQEIYKKIIRLGVAQIIIL